MPQYHPGAIGASMGIVAPRPPLQARGGGGSILPFPTQHRLPETVRTKLPRFAFHGLAVSGENEGMGARGPLRRLDSRRGAAEYGTGARHIQDELTPPPGMPAPVRKIFTQLVDANRAAGVPMRQVDAAIYADLADAMIRRDAAREDMRLWLALSRRVADLRGELLIGPSARARAGVKDVTGEGKPLTRIQQIIELARSRQG